MMLRPTDRKHLFESLRPPEGYELGFAIGTTYSLDLTTLLTVPIGFAFLDYDGSEETQGLDPLLILESIRQFAGKIAVFCQGGQIYVPKLHPILNAYIENSVLQVQAPISGGIFHAKIWVLRYVPHEKGPIKYRLLCLSRNLTFDKSWDTVVALDGEVLDRTNAISTCRPLSEFVSILPKLSFEKPAKQILKAISTISNEILTTQFDFPEGIEQILFWSLGIDPEKKPKAEIFEWPVRAVISPFLCEGFINKYLKDRTENAILVSKRDSLDAINKDTLSAFEKIYTLDDGSSQAKQEEVTEEDESNQLSGLHAKIFHMEQGWDASIVTGSANATLAAFTKNVEFMVELVGKKSKFGIEKFLSSIQGETTFADMLQSYTPPENTIPENAEKKKLENAMIEFCRLIIQNIKNGIVKKNDDEKTAQLSIAWDKALVAKTDIQIFIACRPITLSNMYEKQIVPETRSVVWERVTIESLSSFIVFRIEMKSATESLAHEFVLKILLDGIPEDRLSRITGAVLQNRQEFIRMLMLILGMSGLDGSNDDFLFLSDKPKGASAYGSAAPNGLLEMILAAVSRDPKRIDRIEELVADLKKTEVLNSVKISQSNPTLFFK